MLVMQGPELIVDIGFDPNYGGTGKPANLGAPGVAALVDTGAGESYIDNDLALKLQLPVVNQKVVSGSNGKHAISSYLGHIYVPSLDITHTGEFGGVHLVAGGQRHSALIGRTFLMHFQFTYDGRTGQVELTLP
jgi:predicted aspartyl protease